MIIFLPGEPGRQTLNNPGPVRRGQTTVLCTLRESVQKGFDRVLRIAHALSSEPNVDFRLVGEFDESTLLSPNVVVVPFQKDLTGEISACDVLLLASDWEGVPLTVLEAASVGAWVVAPAIEPLRQALSSWDNVIFLPVQQFEESAVEVLKTLLLLVSSAPVVIPTVATELSSTEALEVGLLVGRMGLRVLPEPAS